MSSYLGYKNVYICRRCAAELVTIDRHEGTTPMLTGCVVPDCGGVSESRFYQVDQKLMPTHEWYRAKGHERLLRHPAAHAHHIQGGLFLRPIQ